MIRRAGIATRLSAVCLAVATIGCGDPRCDAASVAAELEGARAGDVVEIGACSIEADLVVPPGVTLRGADRALSTVRAASSVAVTLTTDASGAAALVGLTIVSDRCAGVILRGSGAARVADVTIRATRGIGLGAEGLSELVLDDVEVLGPLADGSSPTVLPLPPFTCESADPATHGLLVADVSQARLSSVSSRGFAAFGALFVETDLEWTGGVVRDHVGVGLEVYGGRAQLSGLELSFARQDTSPVESFNGVFAAGAVVETEALVVEGGEVFGLFHDGSAATHRNLVARDNGFAGVWSQDAPSLVLRGAATDISGNAFAGVAALRVGEVEVSDARISSTAEGLAPSGPTGAVRAADGVHLVDSPSALLSNLTLSDNLRVGLLADLGGDSTDRLDIRAVTVRGTSAQLGAVAQNGTLMPGWDADLVREGATLANDASFADTLGIAGAVGPSCFPPVMDVVASGLGGLVP